MRLVMAILVGTLYTGGLYMMMRRSITKLIIGLGLLGHASNLLIFTTGRLARTDPPIIRSTPDGDLSTYADPLPQALILTAIVIGFGVQAFSIVLIKRAHETVQTDDLDAMRSTDTTGTTEGTT